MMLQTILNYVAAGFALGAGILWFISARIKTPRSFSIAVDITQSSWDGSVGGSGASADLASLGTTLGCQSYWSARAALCAAASAILTALALAI